jgi:hypothetical protein
LHFGLLKVSLQHMPNFQISPVHKFVFSKVFYRCYRLSRHRTPTVNCAKANPVPMLRHYCTENR